MLAQDITALNKQYFLLNINEMKRNDSFIEWERPLNALF